MRLPRPTLRSLALTLALGAAPLLAACGGGGGSGTTIPAVQSVTWTGAAAQDGYVTANTVVHSSFVIQVGDRDLTRSGHGAFRGLLSFDHGSLPAGAQIQSAILRVRVFNVVGSPLSQLGNIFASHVDYGTSIDSGDYSGGVLTLDLGDLVTTPTLGYHELDVTAAYNADVQAARGRSQFRLLPAVLDANNDGDDDYLEIESGDNAGMTGDLPELVLTYTLP